MANESSPLPDNVLEALQAGQTIEAIKLLRLATGLGLKEAKDAVDAHLQGFSVNVPVIPPANQMPTSVMAALQSGNKIEAIKLLREQTGLGLKEAKDAVEGMEVRKVGGTGNFPTIEKPKSGNGVWWFMG
ncbi:MAG: ribosomal protein L7/L12, partial [Arenimonas sp.]